MATRQELGVSGGLVAEAMAVGVVRNLVVCGGALELWWGYSGSGGAPTSLYRRRRSTEDDPACLRSQTLDAEHSTQSSNRKCKYHYWYNTVKPFISYTYLLASSITSSRPSLPLPNVSSKVPGSPSSVVPVCSIHLHRSLLLPSLPRPRHGSPNS